MNVLRRSLLLALLGYAGMSWGDAFIKALGGHVPVFEIGFFVTLSASVTNLLFVRVDGERWRDFWRMRHPVAVNARAAISAAMMFCSIYAFTHIPLAEVYALIFVAPILIIVLAFLVLGERFGPLRMLAVALGFAGALLVIRPSFSTVEAGHLAALGVAGLSAVSTIIVRSLRGEKRTAIIGTTFAYALAINGVAMIDGFVWPTPWHLVMLVCGGVCVALGQVSLVTALRGAPAGTIAPLHYSQMIWAIALGALIFNELPDLYTVAGTLAICAGGLLTIFGSRNTK